MLKKVILNSVRTIKVVQPGPRGPEGASAYELWLAEGNAGSIADFHAYLGRQAIHVGTQPPENPEEGHLWIDTN
ncbi:MAG: hypothetical protein LPK02_06930 [Rhodobacterales bacterium]|nr:hypothetical protein [Rhodobacterales bacterium]